MRLPSQLVRGQGMAEYIIIIVVVGIFCIGVFRLLGQGVVAKGSMATGKLVRGNSGGGVTVTNHDAKGIGVVARDTVGGFKSFGTLTDKQRGRQNLMTGQ